MHCDYKELPHEGIRTLTPYVPGKSVDELASERGLSHIIKLASNENVHGCSPLVTKALVNLSAHNLATYPQSIHHPLRKQLASHLHVDQSMLTLANGSDSLFGLLLTCFALHTNKHMLTHQYAFSSYAIQAYTLGIPVVTTQDKDNLEVDIDGMIARVTEQTALIFLANPNNPTGLLLDNAQIKRLLASIPSTTLLVLDEAYDEFVHDKQINTLDLLQQYSNLIITRTFSKAYGLAGLRLGYAIAHPDITALLYRIQLPFVVNIAALTAASAALQDTDFLAKTQHMTTTGLRQLEQGLTQLNLPFLKSSGNFITFDCKMDGLILYESLQQSGIIVRPLHPYHLNQYIRVTVGTEEHNTRLLNTLKEFYNHE